MNEERSKSNLADDARKIAKALRFYAHVTGGKTDALALAESLPGKIEASEAWGAEQSCNAEILRLKLESIESGDAEIGLLAQAQDAIDQQIMRAEAAESQLILVTKERDELKSSVKTYVKESDEPLERSETVESLPGKIDALIDAKNKAQASMVESMRQMNAKAVDLDEARKKIEALEKERDDAQTNARRCSDDYMALRKTLAETEHQVDALQSHLVTMTKERDEANELADKVAADSHFNFNSACQERKRADAAESELARVTAERDDARAGRKMISNGSWDTSVMFMECQKEQDTLKSQLAARDAEIAKLRKLLGSPSMVKKTPAGPELFIFGVKVTSWFGTSSNERAYKLANDIDESSYRAAIAASFAEKEQFHD
jgi:chromosome segregation ATPase